ncbi:isoleucine--tRNA ligase [archaeon]|jgi:isoleucyl-tRNA synthetase|nr:isoleucine--tRNA ligase [archaeon]MBT4397655.1 isoleucine--tRNA ligase [archaeon]MBT4441649.1 isoleucine--tRNA ligase [archaeon]
MYDFKKTEEEVLSFWEKNKVFDKLRKKNKGKKKWSFLDGPITANNPMGVHHAEGRTYKDLFQRFKAMQGFDQRYQNGFDCQGLWVEREEEKALGLRDKVDIEKFGILNFAKACRKRVEHYSNVQRDQSIRLGQWMDWENSYYTMTDSNNLHNWMLLKFYFDKGWLYKGKDVVPWCWRCGTASSKHDIITEGYKEVTHKALFMQFPIKGKKNEYFLIFTTTPWTLPGDVAIAVNEEVVYVQAKQGDKYFWLAEARLKELKGDYIVLEQKTGKELEGWEYEMPYKAFEAQKKAPHKVVLWDLASETEGTGIVHIAPGSGAEDHELGKKIDLPSVDLLDDSGVYLDNFGNFSGKLYSKVNAEVIEDMKKRGFIYKVEPFLHRYPHCWRCSEELVFRLVDEWYIKCEEMRPKLIKENRKINWFPKYGKERQEEWFNNMSDWLISRKRYWGLPLPIWECECGEIEVIGSLDELRKKAVDKKKVDNLKEIHRPWVDEIKIKCKKCGKKVSRVEDVGDAWLDAGIVPFSTMGPYLEDKKEWKNWFPSDFICENMPGQYRGWFNALMWSSVALTGKAPFKSILGYESVKDEKGEEMHKSKGNAIWFDDAVEKMGADSMRLLYCLQDPTRELKFGFNAVKEPRQNLNILYNLSNLIPKSTKKNISKIEDKWIMSRINSLIKGVTEELENIHPHLAIRKMTDFWLNDLSRGYIQLVRERVAQGDKEVAFVLSQVYLTLLKLSAPIIPFITESIYQNLKDKLKLKEESIHLCDWPKFDIKLIDEELETKFKISGEIIQGILFAREKAKKGVRWPLKRVTVVSRDMNVKKTVVEMSDLILKQVNIKEIEVLDKMEGVKLDISVNRNAVGRDFKRDSKGVMEKLDEAKLKKLVDKGELKIGKFKLNESHVYIKEEIPKDLVGSNFNKGSVYLDVKLDEELEREGYTREVIRFIQSMRRDEGLVKSDNIELFITGDYDISDFAEDIKVKVGASKIDFDVKKTKVVNEFKIKGKKFKVGFSKIK